ncbi:DDE-type integrase/transposase/recombinase [Defluviicoccus vanus]|uniref:DDE-type integrase/transposase/recombinase n=1 Tax=Defluviicoccus vanus TaxID=111831 RepID=A0A7H1N0M6_9PROT|nr:DDE-type integrase/transposase/recombinase [Defluviicoccus vanus]
MSLQRSGRELIHHYDRGSQYAAGDYRALLGANGIVPSMSQKGNCCNNAPMESWFHTIKIDLVQHTTYPTDETAKPNLFAYICQRRSNSGPL